MAMENKKLRRCKSLKIITEDLVTEIISRVPAKDLMRFTCVSKAWRSLIHTDPYFYRLQTERTVQPPFLLIEKVVKSASASLSYYHYLIHLDLIEDESINLREIRYPFGDRDACVLASCQGLLLLQQRSSQKMVVSNPITRKHSIIPPNPAGHAKVTFCGFGYDCDHNCYKVIIQITDSFELVIYDVNNDMWCEYQWKDRHQYSGLECSGMECVDGGQYWCLEEETSLGRVIEKIICFVLAVGEFHEVETPDFGGVMYYPNVTVLDGRLGLAVEGLNFGRYEVWMINMECDTNKAYSWRWTKVLSLSNPSAMLPSPYDVKGNLLMMIPQCFSACKTRVLFDVQQEVLFWYDLRNHQFRKLNDDPVNRVYRRVKSFVPSLVGIGIF